MQHIGNDCSLSSIFNSICTAIFFVLLILETTGYTISGGLIISCNRVNIRSYGARSDFVL